MSLDYGIAVSLPGYDVKTATLQQLAFTSKYPLYKVLFSGSLSLTMSAASDVQHPTKQSVTFFHNLGYLATFRGYAYTNVAQTQKQPCDIYSTFGQSQTNTVCIRTGLDSLRVQAVNFSNTSISISVFYYIYADPAS